MKEKFFKRKEKNNAIRTEIVIDEDGVIQSESKRFSKEREPDFIKLYVDDIGKILGLTDSERKTIIQLAIGMGYNGVIPLYGPIKQYMMRQLGINNVSLFDRRIKSLKDENILLPVKDPHTGKLCRGLYVINPNLIAKGTWDDIKKMRLILEYTGEGRFMTTQVITNEQIFTSSLLKIDDVDDFTTREKEFEKK